MTDDQNAQILLVMDYVDAVVGGDTDDIRRALEAFEDETQFINAVTKMLISLARAFYGSTDRFTAMMRAEVVLDSIETIFR
jgi:hypothetical protein